MKYWSYSARTTCSVDATIYGTTDFSRRNRAPLSRNGRYYSKNDGAADGASGGGASIIPANSYAYNPGTGLYHKLTAEMNADGNIVVSVEQKGEEK